MRTEILGVSREEIERAKEYILEGGVVAFHTETVYGLGANAFNDDAVQKIFALKGRPADNPLIAHVHSDYDISSLVDFVPDYAILLQKAFLPGPLTMVYPSTGKVSKYVSCGLNTLAIRVPSSVTAQKFLKTVNLPIAAPSANRSKHVSPVTAMHVYDDFENEIPLILDGGSCEGGIESTVLDCTGDDPVVLREGLVTQEMIASVTGRCFVYEKKAGERPKSPGMAYKHYAPQCATAYFSIEELERALGKYREEKERGGRPFFLAESGIANELSKKSINVFPLGDTDEEMAQNLYVQLRRAEKQASLLICLEPTVCGGVMAGVMNRLKRAFGIGTEED